MTDDATSTATATDTAATTTSTDTAAATTVGATKATDAATATTDAAKEGSTSTTDTKAAATATTVPESYTLTLPEGSTLDASVIERTAATARELGLSNAAAQKMLETTNAEVQQYLTAEHAAFEAKAQEWKTTVLGDPKYGKTPEERMAAIDKGRQVIDVHFAKVDPDGAAALKTFLNDTTYGNHPAVVSLMHWLGKQGEEGPLVLPNAASGNGVRSKEQAYREMFPNSYEEMAGKK